MVFFCPIDRDLTKVDPTKSPPISPGPHVAENMSISSIFKYDSFRAFCVMS